MMFMLILMNENELLANYYSECILVRGRGGGWPSLPNLHETLKVHFRFFVS